MSEIHQYSWENLDLNLLRVFVVIWQERHLGAASERLNLTPSAVSHALRRLREHLGDELFVRAGRRLKPTAKAQHLGPIMQDYIDQLRGLIESQSTFDPSTSRRNFVVGLRDPIESTFLPNLMRVRAEEAPNINVHSVRLDRTGMVEQLRQGQLDFAIDVQVEVPELVRQSLLTSDPLIVIMRKSHPLRGRLTVESYLNAEHILVSGRAMGAGVEDMALAKMGFPARKIILKCQNYQAAGLIAEQSDVLVTRPRGLTQAFVSAAGLHQEELPIADINFDIHLYWHIRAESDAGLLWFKELIRRVFKLHYRQ